MKPSTARRYTLQRRAESQEATRRRIVQAAVDLHGTVGPARTNVSAIAARAGVQRHTVYRHFPDETSLFRACTAHFLGQEPPPDTDSWATVQDFSARLRRGLGELYTYYQQNETMIANVLRDSEVLPVGAGFRTLQSRAATALSRRSRGRPGRRLMAVLAVATDFQTWRTLVRGGLPSDEAAGTMAEMVKTSV